MRHDLADFLFKTSVDHAIRFVENEQAALAQGKTAAVEHVLEAAGRRDDKVDAAAQLGDLIGEIDAADAQHRAKLGKAGARDRGALLDADVVNLARKLA